MQALKNRLNRLEDMRQPEPYAIHVVEEGTSDDHTERCTNARCLHIVRDYGEEA